jgi:hypothetical protein
MNQFPGLPIILLVSFSLTALAEDKLTPKDCGPIPPGGMFDQNCNIKISPPPPQNQGDAQIIGEVIEVKCGVRTKEFQEYLARIRVEKVIRGKVENTIELKFSSYFDSKPRFGDNGISFLKGDRSKLILTKYKDYWAVQFPFHKEVIRASGGILPACQ